MEYQGLTQVVLCSDIVRRPLIANYVCYSTLKAINEELDKIAAQGPCRLGTCSDLNTTAVDGYLNHLPTALEKFKVCPTLDVHGLYLDVGADDRQTQPPGSSFPSAQNTLITGGTFVSLPWYMHILYANKLCVD